MSLDPIKDRRLDQLLDGVSEEWLTTPNDALDGDTPRERLQHWHNAGCLRCRAEVCWLIEDMEKP